MTDWRELLEQQLAARDEVSQPAGDEPSDEEYGAWILAEEAKTGPPVWSLPLLPADGVLPDPDEETWESCGWFYGDDDAEEASYLGSLPADVREAYLAGPWTGAGEVMAAGFVHHQDDGIAGSGFAAGGHLDRLAPGPELATAAAAAGDRAGLGESELVGVLCGWQRLTSWAQAGQAAALIALVARRKEQAVALARPALAGHVDDEVAAALSLTGGAAGRLLGIAAGLAGLPEVLAALAAGRIDWVKAGLFTGYLAGLPGEAGNQIAAVVLAQCDHRTSGQLRKALIGAVLAYDPESAQRRRAEARREGCVQLWPEPSGNSALAGRELDPADAIAADARLTGCARWLHDHGAEGTMDQLRVAAFLALLTGRPLGSLLPGPAGTAGTAAGTGPATTLAAGGGADEPGTGQAGGDRGDRTGGDGEDQAGGDRASGDSDGAACHDGGPVDAARDPGLPGPGEPQLTGTINLTLPLSAWLGLSSMPGELTGYGVTDAAASRSLAARTDTATRWCLTLTGRDGRAVAHACATGPPPRAGPGAITWAEGLRARLQFLQAGTCDHTRQTPGYRPPGSLRHLICIRQRTCAFPGCWRPSRRTDLDHTIPYHRGGKTCECNLAPLCRRHHQAKQAPGWTLTQHQPGVMTWQLPHGRAYTTTPEPYPA